MKTNIKASECTFLLLAKLPNGEVHQVIIGKDDILDMLHTKNSIQILEKPIGIDFFPIAYIK